jgi:hypothetical protein
MFSKEWIFLTGYHMDSETHKKLIKALNKRDNSVALRVMKRAGHLLNSKDIVDYNYNSLKTVMGFHKNNAKKLFKEKDHEALQKICKELIITLHNYTSSVYSLKCHLTTFSSKIKPEFRVPLNKKIDSLFKKDEEMRIILCIRTEYQHTIPIPTNISFSEHYDTKNGEVLEKYTCNLLIENLSPKIWTDRDINIKNFDKGIELENIITNSHEKINDFFIWFDNSIKYHYKKEYEEYVEKEKNLRTLLDSK